MLVDTAVILAGRWRHDGEALQWFAINQQFDVVNAGDAFDVFIAIASEANLHFILGIDGESVPERFASARAQGKSVEVFFLRKVGRKVDRFTARGACRDANGQTSDFAGRRKISFQKRGGEFADSYVVKPVAGFVGRKEASDVNVNGEQVPDGILVLGSIQAPEGVRASRIGLLAIECRLNGTDRGDVGGFGRMRNIRRRHRAATQAAKYFFPAFGMLLRGTGFEVQIS